MGIIIAAVISFVFSWLWYGPLFGKTWMRLSKMTMEDMKAMNMTPAKSMALGFVSAILVVYVFSMFMGMLSVADNGEALRLAFWVWLGFAMPIQAGGWLWEGKLFKLFLFNTAYQLITYGIIVVALLML